MKQFGGVYGGARVLVTGHTGFKGSWLVLWLQRLGADITGVALDPDTTPAHWNLLQLGIDEHRLDIRDRGAVREVIRRATPDVVFHLAAQALVRRSYQDPIGTWATNVMGTAHVLDACREQPSVRAVVVVTTDKCYENREWEWGYRENDALGGHDPYAASKAGAELLVSSYRRSFCTGSERPLLATARAGNVIGGGDWSTDRLLPDAARAVAAGTALKIRSPRATRPWQHVLDPLAGYLSLGQHLLEGNSGCADAWNFGPPLDGNRSVHELLVRLEQFWPQLQWDVELGDGRHEAALLHLDSTKAQRALGWRPVWNVDEALGVTAEWYRQYMDANIIVSSQQLDDYVTAAGRARVSWCAA